MVVSYKTMQKNKKLDDFVDEKKQKMKKNKINSILRATYQLPFLFLQKPHLIPLKHLLSSNYPLKSH